VVCSAFVYSYNITIFNIDYNGDKRRMCIMTKHYVDLKTITGKEVKGMRNLLSIVIAITMVISTTGVSFAAFQSLGSETYSATSGEVGGEAGVTVPFSASLKNISGDTTASSIAWTGVSAGSTGWLAANQYVTVKGWTTYSDWGIQIYTNNTNYTGTGSPAGLINVSNTLYSLPMAWRATTEKLDAGSEKLGIVGKVLPSGDHVLADGTVPEQEYYPWFYVLDKQQDMDTDTEGIQAFGNYQTYATFIGSDGYQHAPDDYASPGPPETEYYVYLGANFTTAAPGATYSTNSLTVEMYRL
jgi:hypothetical protein